MSVLNSLESMVGDLAGADFQSLGDGELLDVLTRLEACSRRLHAVSLAVISEVDRRGVAGEVGATSTAALVRQVLLLSPAEAKKRVETARDLASAVTPTGSVVPPRLGVAAEGLRAGDVSDEHVQVLRRALKALPDQVSVETRVEVEQTLMERAREFDPVQLGRLAKRIQLLVDPDGSLRSEEEAVRSRELSICRGMDGMYRVRGRLDAEAATTLVTALAPLAAPQAAVDGVKDLRTGAQRYGDALMELARRALNAGDLPVQGGQRPQVTVTVTYETLAKGLGNAGVAVLDNGEPITAEAARRIACDCKIVPVVLGSKSEPLDVGREQRVVTAAIRRALVTRDGGCAFPGCDRHPQWTDAHHIVHWVDDGETSLANTVLLCGQHHGLVHAQGWEIVMIDERPHFIPPLWLDVGRTPRRNHMHRPIK